MLSYFAIVPIMIAILLFVVPVEKLTRSIAAVAQAALCVYAFYIFRSCKDGDIVTVVGSYEGFLGITLKADTLASVFLMLTSLLFLIATVYSLNSAYSRLFWFLLFSWQGLLNGIFMSNDMFNIFVLVEVATVVVAAIIMFNRDNRSMYDGMVYLMVNIVAMQFYLFGVGYLYKLTGTLDLAAAAEALKQYDKPALILPYALIMTAISLKCALMPLFSWLPKAYTPSTPAAATALLSGIHAKIGVYLFIRFHFVFGDVLTPEFFLIVGAVTGILGAVMALSQTDILKILAYSTISQIGLIMIGLNVSDIYSYTGGIYHILNHAIFKSALFLCAGIITEAYGTREISGIRGVLRRYPLVGAAVIMAVFGITGTPFFNGSISKYFILSGTSRIVTAAAIIINLGTIIIFIKFSAMLFGPGQGSRPDSPSSCPLKTATVLALGVLCFAGGVFGEQAIHFLFNTAVNIDAAGYIEKTILFTASAIAGYFIYRFFVDKLPFFKKIREIDLSFRQICASIGAFFATTLIVAWLS